MTAFRALLRKELASLFGSPTAYLTLMLVALVTALIFFDHLRLYNQILFVYASSNMGGFDTDVIPDYVNLWDSVFFPVMETLGLTLIGAVPLLTMRVFAEERARGTDELLVSTAVSPWQIVLAKFLVTFLFVVMMMAVSFVYPASAIERGGLGAQHLAAVFLGLTLHGIGLASIGLACSAFTSSQLVAAAAGWAVAFVLWDFGWIDPFVSERTAAVLNAFALHPRYGSFSEGIVALDNMVYFAALALVCMALARFSFDLRRVGS
ncbi:MAG TPA: ABC transporter permease [Myxococcota bacterium]|nr:ABC transporter permease [Myxococcota bacterium]